MIKKKLASCFSEYKAKLPIFFASGLFFSFALYFLIFSSAANAQSVDYTLSYSAGPNGTISGASSQIVNSGNNGSAVTAIPATGYHFVNWSDNIPTASRTDTDVMASISVTAYFATNTSAFTIGGTVINLNSSMVLQDNNSDNLIVNSINSRFTFPIPLNNGASYLVTVYANPAKQTCTVIDGAGTVTGSNVTGILVSCADSFAPAETGSSTPNQMPTNTSSLLSNIEPPGEPINFAASSYNGNILLTWTNPDYNNFAGVQIIRKVGSQPEGFGDTGAKTIYQGAGESFVDATSTASGLTYYYSIYSYNFGSVYSVPLTISIRQPAVEPVPSSTVLTLPATKNVTSSPDINFAPVRVIASLFGASSTTVDHITASETVQLLSAVRFVDLSAVEKKVYANVIALSAESLSSTTKFAIADFIQQGTPTTVKLGAGERGGSVASFAAAFGKLPTTNDDWQDVIKIGNGRWPAQRNTSAENLAKAQFKKIYLRLPNLSVGHDYSAVMIMAYGLRPSSRNLKSERAAINSFEFIFKKIPVSAADWNDVMAIAYSGAKR
jgi:Divergent InlB B-repeat domain